MTTTKHISLDVQRPNLIPSLSAKQYDSESRLIDVTITEMGETVEVSDSATILFNIQKPDGSNASYNGSVNEDGTVHLVIPIWALDTNGDLLCSVSILENDTRLSTLRFTITVEGAETLAEPSEDEKDVWTEALLAIQKLEETALTDSDVITEIDSSSTDEKIPSAKAVVDYVEKNQPDLNDYLKRDGTEAMYGNLNMNNNFIEGCKGVIVDNPPQSPYGIDTYVGNIGYNDTRYLQANAKVTQITASSTDNQIPSAKAVHSAIQEALYVDTDTIIIPAEV